MGIATLKSKLSLWSDGGCITLTSANKMASILLVEPDYPTRFPPLGLMKIASYHSSRGDAVRFVRGLVKTDDYYDRVYVSTLFSFHHAKTIRTISHYKEKVNGDLARIWVGGIYATLFPEVIYKETGVYPHVGLLDKPGILGGDDVAVDQLTPDYSILDQVEHDYGLRDSYIGYATRGCPNKCAFCAVHQIEPTFAHYVGLRTYIEAIKQKHGERQNLVLMDNNVLASKQFDRIVRDIRALGFQAGAKRNGRKRFVDFNQGLDAALVNPTNAKLLASICLDPLRLAYDHVKERRIFERAIRTLADAGCRNFSTYLLFNFQDSPSELYQRMRHVIDLNTQRSLMIYSFPMRYTPLGHADRKYVGPKWSRREIRGVQCVLNVTKGLVSHRRDLFLRAFGESPQEMDEILWMPDEYILQRNKHENRAAAKYREVYGSLSAKQREEFKGIVGPNDQDLMKERYPRIRSKAVKKLVDAHLS